MTFLEYTLSVWRDCNVIILKGFDLLWQSLKRIYSGLEGILIGIIGIGVALGMAIIFPMLRAVVWVFTGGR